MAEQKSNKPVAPTIQPTKSKLVENSYQKPGTVRQPKPQAPKNSK